MAISAEVTTSLGIGRMFVEDAGSILTYLGGRG